MTEDIEIRHQPGHITRGELFSYLKSVDEEYIPPISACADLDEYASKLFNKANIVSVWNKENLIGLCAFYCNESDKKSFITTISVRHAFKKKGIGRVLLNKTVSISRALNMKKISLEVNSDNHSAIRFYKKNDFKTSKIYEKKDADGVNREWHLMIKDIQKYSIHERSGN